MDFAYHRRAMAEGRQARRTPRLQRTVRDGEGLAEGAQVPQAEPSRRAGKDVRCDSGQDAGRGFDEGVHGRLRAEVQAL